MSSEGFGKKQSFREELVKDNYNIVLPEYLVNNNLVQNFLNSTGLNYADREYLTTVVADKVLENREKWPHINPDADLLNISD